MARQVSHPNVCRVYDVGEFEGHTFLSMEYVDGEDLSSLLRRIGRFPEDRAIELARQICAGLAAAHERGVVHRDLKPANIMLDGNGRHPDHRLRPRRGGRRNHCAPARRPTWRRSSSPAARSRRAATSTALGLVLYELFTGRRALDGRNLAELIAKREQDGITQPSEIVRDLDPAIDRAIMRCLRAGTGAAPGVGARGGGGAARAAIRWRRRSRRVKRRHRKWWRRPGRRAR